jgi:hypothetical protein
MLSRYPPISFRPVEYACGHFPMSTPTNTENTETNGACGQTVRARKSGLKVPSLQCRELLAKSQAFKKQSATSAEESKNRTPPGVQRRLIMRRCCRIRLWTAAVSCLKSQADQILANDTGSHGAWKPLFVRCGRSQEYHPPTTGPDGTQERLKLLPKILACQPRAVHQAQLVDASQFTLEALEQFLRGVIQV